MLSSIKLFFSTYETYAKIAVILFYTMFIWYCHGVYDKAKLASVEAQQIVRAQAGETNLVDKHQKLRKAYAKIKDTCSNTAIPTSIIKLLK